MRVRRNDMASLQELAVEYRSGLWGPDIARLKALSPMEFRKCYVADMTLFIAEHRKLTGHAPTCTCCSRQIGSGNELVRYFGTNLHHECFVSTYGEERQQDTHPGFSTNETEYFDLVMGRVAAA